MVADRATSPGNDRPSLQEQLGLPDQSYVADDLTGWHPNTGDAVSIALAASRIMGVSPCIQTIERFEDAVRIAGETQANSGDVTVDLFTRTVRAAVNEWSES